MPNRSLNATNVHSGIASIAVPRASFCAGIAKREFRPTSVMRFLHIGIIPYARIQRYVLNFLIKLQDG
jgi:hypothetical protein